MAVSRAIQLACAVGVATLTLAACDQADDDPRAGEGREAAVYESILEWILDEEPVADTDERPGWTMFVGSRHERPIAVDVQVLVVETLDERIVVRFIDERAEAVDEDADKQPVRENGMLVGLGAVPAEGDRVDVYVDRYRETDDVDAWEVTVRRAGESWTITGVPIATDVRPLPPSD
jgi:hypothetical protein